MPVILETNLPPKKYHVGKVRDIYEVRQWVLVGVGPERLCMAATDRISAFDVVLPDGIPYKGIVLTLLSAFWFKRTEHIVPNHFLMVVDKAWLKSKEGKTVLDKFHASKVEDVETQLVNRAMLVKKAERIDIECVVRGYLSGSAWLEYRKNGTVCGEKLPSGLQESQELPQPIFTPTTKAESGHDLPITITDMINSIGVTLTEEIKQKSLAIYDYARRFAVEKGIIIADTKLEFGLDNGELILIDELLTPDSSRFWDVNLYKVGQSQPSYDKQPVRDWLTQSGWNKEPPAPSLPPEVIRATSKRYRTAYERLTGEKPVWHHLS